ncbi:MAG TPA: dihydroorotase [Chitinophagales bacterium]
MLLIRSAKVVFPNSEFNGKTVDIFIENGRVKRIGTKLRNTENAKEITGKNLHISAGFVDLHSYIGEPGLEQKETVDSACKAAEKGGITKFCVLPNEKNPADTKSSIEFLIKKSASHKTQILPVGTVTHKLEGKDLAELFDMHSTGAIAFSDGLHTLANAGILERALRYTSAFGGLVMQHAEDKSMSKNGVVHESIISTQIGLPGIPAAAEEIAVARDLAVLEYAKGKLHLLDISLKKSVELIKAAKKKDLQVTASVNAYNLLLTHEATRNYDTNTKVNPPLREQHDINALIKGIEDGTIDAITSQHNPQDEECKKLEFDKADFGIIGFETLFAIVNTILTPKIGIEKVVSLLAEKPRQILGLPAIELKENTLAEFTLFDPTEKWMFTAKDIYSKSKNTPFVGTEFTGKVIGVVR